MLLCGEGLTGGGWSRARGLVSALKRESQEGDPTARAGGVPRGVGEKGGDSVISFGGIVTKFQLN